MDQRCWVRWIARGAAAAGLLALLIAFSLDALGLSHPGFGTTQGGVAAVGLLAVFSGYWLARFVDPHRARPEPASVLLTAIVLVIVPIAVIYLHLQFEFVSRLSSLPAPQEHIPQRISYLERRMNEVETRTGRISRRLPECAPHSLEPPPPVAAKLLVEGLEKAVKLTHAGDRSGRLFVVEKAGRLRVILGDTLLLEPMLDITEQVLSDSSDPPGHIEQGMFSAAFHPDYANNGRVFLSYTAHPDGRTVIAEYRTGADPDRLDPDSERVLLEVPQPYPAHNGGHLLFGPDGLLYVGMGDGGVPPESPKTAPEYLGSLLGKILRVDVDSARPYGIPADNPFVRREGARPEIFALGFRNPWSFSFDLCDDSLFVGDVGGNRWEEIDLVFKGGDYGWKRMEGTHCYPPGSLCDRTGVELPIAEYGHPRVDARGGQAVTGGYVYRGTEFRELVGRYFFADFYSTRLWSLTERPWHPGRWEREELGQLGFPASAFGEGPGGEIFLVDYNGAIYQLVQQGPASRTTRP